MNKNLSKAVLSVLTVLALVTVTSCKQKLTDTPLENMNVIADFSTGENETFFPSDGWCNGEPFNVTWSTNNVAYENGAAKLSITEEDNKFYGGELRSHDHFSYGDYQITMKPEPKKGTCTSFFVYTGPTEFDENGNPNPHDEIDIEFLGKDTTHVQFNFFVDGKGGNEHMYDLGFDASLEFHTYGFRWTETYITWYVDGVAVYRVDESRSKPLPKTPGRLMMNYWCGTKKAEAWMSKYSHPETGEGSEYSLIETSATPIKDETEKPNDNPNENQALDWTKINPLVGILTESSDGTHAITETNGAYNVVYENVKGGSYNNVKFVLDDKAFNMNYVYLKATNNSNKSANIRIDVFGDATRKSTNNQYVCNVSATMDGATVPTDLDWGGSTFNSIPAGKTVEIIIYYEGIANSLQIMFDSATYNDTNVYSGNVTISDIKLTKDGELKLPGNSEPGTNPGTGTTTNALVSINGVEKKFEGNLESYALTVSNNQLSVVYENIVGNSYKNINASITDIANNMNVFTVKITNTGSTTVKIRIDVNSATKVNETNASNVSATQDGQSVYTDTTWGGSTFTIAAGATCVCVVTFDTSRGPTNVMFYFDSSQYDDSTAHSGSITLSEMIFTKQ